MKRREGENDHLFFNNTKDRDRWVQDKLSRIDESSVTSQI
jgi:hypothetical protein